MTAPSVLIDEAASTDSSFDLKWRRRTTVEMIISGLIGLYASFVLSIEAWQLAAASA